MPRRQVALDALIGRVVRDHGGRSLGRIEEVHADTVDGVCEIREYVLGAGALVERLGAWRVGRWLLGRLGSRRSRRVVPWDELDIDDPRAPRLRSAARHGEGRLA